MVGIGTPMFLLNVALLPCVTLSVLIFGKRKRHFLMYPSKPFSSTVSNWDPLQVQRKIYSKIQNLCKDGVFCLKDTNRSTIGGR